MTNLEILESAIDFNHQRYFREFSVGVTEPAQLSIIETNAIESSCQALFWVLNAEDKNSNVYCNYTRQNGLRQNLISLSRECILNELLKNVVNVARWHISRGTPASKRIGEVITPGSSDDEISVIILNNLERYGVEKAYEMLEDPSVLYSSCRSFAYYRRQSELTHIKCFVPNSKGGMDAVYHDNCMKHQLDQIALTDRDARYFNNELDTHYTRFADGRRTSY